MNWRPAYLIHGDEHGRIAERRARLRALAEGEGGASGVEVFEGAAATAEAVVAALSSMTFAIGRRFVIVDGVESWKDADAEMVAAALASPAPDTTVAFFAREEGRAKAPAALAQAVTKAGGTVVAEQGVKPWDLPKWAVEQARALDLALDPAAARALVQRVGERQQRLLRELEKLALELGPRAHVGAEEIEELTAPSAERKAWSLADALVARDAAAATRLYLDLRSQGERLQGLMFTIVRRFHDAQAVAARLEAGESAAQVRRSLRMPPKAAERFVADVQRTDADRLAGALETLADLELTTRGGGTLPPGPEQLPGRGMLAEDTAAVQAILRLAA